MQHKRKFIIRTLFLFIATTIVVGVLVYFADTYDHVRTVNIFAVSLLVLHTLGEVIDPRQIRDKRAMIKVHEEDIKKLKSDVSFLKYLIQKELDMEFGELHLKSSIWREMEIEEEEDSEGPQSRRD